MATPPAMTKDRIAALAVANMREFSRRPGSGRSVFDCILPPIVQPDPDLAHGLAREIAALGFPPGKRRFVLAESGRANPMRKSLIKKGYAKAGLGAPSEAHFPGAIFEGIRRLASAKARHRPQSAKPVSNGPQDYWCEAIYIAKSPLRLMICCGQVAKPRQNIAAISAMFRKAVQNRGNFAPLQSELARAK